MQKRVLGAEHPSTLSSGSNLAGFLSKQGNYADAEQIEREVLAAQKRLLGAEHPDTLMSANNLAVSLPYQGKYAEAERMLHDVLASRRRVLGPAHPYTLQTASSLEGVRALIRAKHPWTVLDQALGIMESNFGLQPPTNAAALLDQGKHADAEQMLHDVLASLQRVLGPAHPDTLEAARTLEHVRAAIRATPPTNAASPAAAGAARPLPAGTRVLVQRLVAKPEHNGKRARVVSSFNACTGRYIVALDDGKELSLKAECVARAGCAAAGCASEEEASSVCGRCEAVRYCSRECQRTDWKAHKPVCTAQTHVSADCVVHAVVQETSLTSSSTENVDRQSNTPLSVYDTKPGSTDAPPEDDARHVNVTLESKKWIFIGVVALIVLVAGSIVVLLVANSRSRQASNKHFDF